MVKNNHVEINQIYACNKSILAIKYGGVSMNKVVSLEEAISHIEDGMTIMVGGFLGCGTPHKLVDALVEKGVKDLTLICNDTGFVDIGSGKLVVNKQIKTSMLPILEQTKKQVDK